MDLEHNGRSRRPTWLEIDLAAVAANVRLLRGLVPPATGLMAVVKADAYGHGLVRVAAAALDAGAAWLGVALPEEGLELRRAGIAAPVLVLGPSVSEQAPLVAAGGLSQTVASPAALEALAREGLARGTPVPVQVKVDTGMGRLGLSPERALPFLRRAAATSGVRLEGAFTHLARADDPDPEPTRRQLAAFRLLREAAAAEGLAVPLWHAANSAAVFRFPESHLDLVRTGIALYGLEPFPDPPAGLRAALTWKTRIAFLKEVETGTPLSYGATYHAPGRMKVATLPVGYADGYSRGLSNRGQALVGGIRCQVVGRVCMDQILLDVTPAPAVQEGDEVVLLGAQGNERITAEEMAGWLGTINYEVVSRLSRRVPRLHPSSR